MRLLAPGSGQRHGADVYDLQGRPLPGSDFSSTVVSIGPPRGWRLRAAGALDALTRYPQPYGRGLDVFLEGALGLASGSVLVSNGASEALEWIARLASAKRARLVAPCFGEYRAKLERAGARVSEAWWRPGEALDPDELLRGLKAGDQLWIANPSNPLGRVLGPDPVSQLEQRCRRSGVLLVLDEALMAQRLDALADPGAYPGAKGNACLVVVRSLGKGIGLPGLRLGYLAAAPSLAAKLRVFQDPWSVNGLARGLGAWAFEEERRAAEARRKALHARARNLLLALTHARPAMQAPSAAAPQTGYICLDLGAPVAGAVASRLAHKGLFVRDCSSFGGWGRSWLRLNPRTAPENRALARAVGLALRRA